MTPSFVPLLRWRGTWEWKKSPKEMPATFNARAESVASKPMFRNAFKGRRCIIPASGFYEWTGEKGDKQPHLFTAADGSPILAFAGLWDRWHDPESGEEVLSCTIIVSGASEWMKVYHDRMPMILEPKDFDVATDARPEKVQKIFRRTYAVGAHFGLTPKRYQSGETDIGSCRVGVSLEAIHIGPVFAFFFECAFRTSSRCRRSRGC